MHHHPAPKAFSAAVRVAFSRVAKRFPDFLAGMLVLTLVRAAALLPLAALLAKSGSPWRYAALLTPVLYLFAVLPLRYAMGEAMSGALDGGAFCTARLFDLTGYGKRMKAVLWQGLHLLPWALPLGAGAVFMLIMYRGNAVTFARMLISIGKWLGPDGNFMDGAYVLAAIGAALLLLLLYGMARNGMVRFLWREMGGEYGAARREMLKRLKGQRAGQFSIALLQSAMVLPVLALEAYLGYRMFRLNAFVPGLFYGMAAGVIALYWPLLPLRKAMQAAYIRLLGAYQTSGIAEQK